VSDLRLVLQEVQSTKTYSLGPLTLQLTPGLHIISGKNGSGKSTLLKLIAGVIPLMAGSITLIKREREYDMTSYKSRLGYASQEIAAYEEMRAENYLRYVGRMKLIPSEFLEARIDQVITELHINAWVSGKIDQLSMGQKRVLMLAQAILADPDILLLDETLESLDIEQQNHVIGLLHQRAKHSIILIASHRTEQWKDHAAQCMELSAGELTSAIWI
jgi:ABC-2 type transport system ATP-binding protein